MVCVVVLFLIFLTPATWRVRLPDMQKNAEMDAQHDGWVNIDPKTASKLWSVG